MTAQIFPQEFYRSLLISNPGGIDLDLNEFTISTVKPNWQ